MIFPLNRHEQLYDNHLKVKLLPSINKLITLPITDNRGLWHIIIICVLIMIYSIASGK